MFQTLEVARSRRPIAVPSEDLPAGRSCTSPLLAEDARPWGTQLADYVRAVPKAAADDAVADLAGCLNWLKDGDPDDDSGLAAAPRSLGAVESMAIRQWLLHLRFQSQLRRSGATLAAATPRSRLTVQLNPTHVWSRVEPRPWCGASADGTAAQPQAILLVAVGDDTRTIALPQHVAEWLRRLERSGPQPLRTALSGVAAHSGDDAFDLLRQLVAAGVIAVT